MKHCADCRSPNHEYQAVRRHRWWLWERKRKRCNWLDWMVVEAGGVCPHCGGPVTEVTTATPLGRVLDRMTNDLE